MAVALAADNPSGSSHDRLWQRPLEDLSSRGHARRGARLARQRLWLADADGLAPAPFHAREAVVGLVRYHGLPLLVLDFPCRFLVS